MTLWGKKDKEPHIIKQFKNNFVQFSITIMSGSVWKSLKIRILKINSDLFYDKPYFWQRNISSAIMKARGLVLKKNTPVCLCTCYQMLSISLLFLGSQASRPDDKNDIWKWPMYSNIAHEESKNRKLYANVFKFLYV